MICCILFLIQILNYKHVKTLQTFCFSKKGFLIVISSDPPLIELNFRYSDILKTDYFELWCLQQKYLKLSELNLFKFKKRMLSTTLLKK